MINFPNEIINIILSYRDKHPLSVIMNYLIYNCYMNDFEANYSYYNYYYEYYFEKYSFFQWYFRIICSRQKKLTNIKKWM